MSRFQVIISKVSIIFLIKMKSFDKYVEIFTFFPEQKHFFTACMFMFNF